MPQHRTGAAVWSANQSFELVFHDSPHESSIDSSVQQHVVVVAPFQVDLKELVRAAVELLPRASQSESI